MKTCTKCRKEKPLTEYTPRYRSENKTYYPACRKCRNEAHTEWRLKKSYGLSKDDLDKRLEDQDFQCKICKADISLKFSVDHDHATGRVRGILCMNCNIGLGHFKDSTKNLKAAIRYLEKEELYE